MSSFFICRMGPHHSIRFLTVLTLQHLADVGRDDRHGTPYLSFNQPHCSIFPPSESFLIMNTSATSGTEIGAVGVAD